MPPVPDFQGVLLDKAAQDARAAEVMRDDVRFSDEIVGFHCQQAVEKAIKAVLETLRIEYPLNHDLVVLLNLLGEHAFACPVSLDEAKQLKPFAGTLSIRRTCPGRRAFARVRSSPGPFGQRP